MATDNIIACRELEKDGRKYEVRIRQPYREEEHYVCAWSLVDDSSVAVIDEFTHGVDSAQALLMALLIIGERLAAESEQFTFMGVQDSGFLRILDLERPGSPAWICPQMDLASSHLS